MEILQGLMDPGKWVVFGKSAALFIVVLGALVFFHELGHFLVARACGVTVVTFSLGFGPKMLTRQRGDTQYCLSLIPLGGYVRMLGDDPSEVVAPEARERAFSTQATHKKCAIVVAGPGFNFILALVLFAMVYMFGVPVLTPHIGEVMKDSAAEAGGIKAGDTILSIEGAPITEWEQLADTLQKTGGKEVAFLVERDGAQIPLHLTPVRQETTDLFGDTQTLWRIGVQPKGTQITRRYNPIMALWMGAQKTWEMSVLNVVSIFKMIQGKISSDNIGGPILIAQMASQQAAQGLLNVILFTAVISVSLGVMNLFPVPILDGGHLFFFLIEGALGRPLKLRTKEMASQAGLALLLLLMGFALYNDIMRLLTK